MTEKVISEAFRTERLLLYPLDGEDLDHLSESRDRLEGELGLERSGLQTAELIRQEVGRALKQWKTFVRAEPDCYRWGTNWEVIERMENRSIGGIGLSGRPDEEGGVTVGYVIDERFQSRGYATEALRGLLEWAFQEDELLFVEALSSTENLASHRVLAKNGFQKIKELEWKGLRLFSWRLCRPTASAPAPGPSTEHQP